jgi:hypothetical protein
LRNELVSLYTADTGRRVFVESVIPWVLHAFTSSQSASTTGKAKKNDETLSTDVVNHLIVEEIAMDEYESFDDYLEMIIELGYVLLFASAFPLAAPLSMFANLVEFRSDIFKLTSTTRRPIAEEARNIDPWVEILTVIVWMSALTNVAVMGFTSEQLKTIFPNMFKDLGNTHKATKDGIELMVCMEHALLFVGLLITFGVREFPSWVRDDMARRNFEKSQALVHQRQQALAHQHKAPNSLE